MSNQITLVLEVDVFHKSDIEQTTPLTLEDLGIVGTARLSVQCEDVLNKNDTFEFDNSEGKRCVAYLTSVDTKSE